MKAIYLDCFSGISGNMFLGALIDAGFPIDVLRCELEKLNLGNYTLVDVDVERCGIRANYFDVKLPEHHDGEHHYEYRNLGDIEKILNNSHLQEKVKSRAKEIFRVLAQAEAKVHGTTVDTVHFHEVGACDTIIDIVGVLLGLEFLHVDKVFAGVVTTGYGFVNCAHGTMPVPAPATAELLNDLPQTRGFIESEMTTPTGAVLVKCLAEYSLDMNLHNAKVFYGAGSRDHSIPNVLRLYIGDCPDSFDGDIVEAQCNLDNETGEAVAYCCELLFAGGALDVWTEAVMMKKGRPGVKLCFLTVKDNLEKLAALVLKHTSTIGLRYYFVRRFSLPRRFEKVSTEYGIVQRKISTLADGSVKISAEYDDCALLATKNNVPLRTVQNSALSAESSGGKIDI